MPAPALFFEVAPAGGPVNGVVYPPGSKSITNRALLLSALAHGESSLHGCLLADDTILMMAGLKNVGFQVRRAGNGDTVLVRGGGGTIPWHEGRIWTGNAGTVARFLMTLLPLGLGSYRLDGDDRLRDRPVRPLVETLKSLGADVSFAQENGRLPVIVKGEGGLRGGCARVDGSDSSQFISALLLAGPAMSKGLDLLVEGRPASRPYVDLTLDMMTEFGASVMRDGYSRFEIPPCRYSGRDFSIEADASSAAFFLSAAAITGGRVKVAGISPSSRQPDAGYAKLLEAMGVKISTGPDWIEAQGGPLRGGVFDLNGMPDSAMALTVTALFAESPTEIVNAPNLRLKESDRISSLAAGIRAMGGRAEELDGGLRIVPCGLHGAVVRSAGDHRIAMAFAIAGLAVPGVVIEDPNCVSKSYPDFFDRLGDLTGKPGRKFRGC